ncbi:MAG: triose-phosphate isomerase [Actinomycetota bacterium]|nr:triose-phosphate isomerase [Actinomycetota bacterium]
MTSPGDRQRSRTSTSGASRSGRTPLMAGNWKMNLNHLEAIALVQRLAFTLSEAELAEVEVAVLPPFTDLRSVQTLVEGERLSFAYGAQDLSAHASGAYTGEIAASMLAKLGCTYVLVGHSERRRYHGESDDILAAKVRAAYAAGLTPILCVGEDFDDRDEQGRTAEEFVVGQVRAALRDLPADSARTVVLAYEPVWAIGTGKTATPEHAQRLCAAIRTELAEIYSGGLADAVRVLYGGSVKGDNIASIMAGPDIDGALVGGASVVADEFVSIVRNGAPA